MRRRLVGLVVVGALAWANARVANAQMWLSPWNGAGYGFNSVNPAWSGALYSPFYANTAYGLGFARGSNFMVPGTGIYSSAYSGFAAPGTNIYTGGFAGNPVPGTNFYAPAYMNTSRVVYGGAPGTIFSGYRAMPFASYGVPVYGVRPGVWRRAMRRGWMW